MRGRLLTVSLSSLLTAGCVLGSSSDDCAGHCWKPTEADVMFIGGFCAAVAPCCTGIGQPEKGGCAGALLSAGVSSNSELTAACLAEMQQIQSSPARLFDVADVNDPCSRVFNEPSGPHGPGERCSVNADCAGIPGATGAGTAMPPGPASRLCPTARAARRTISATASASTLLAPMAPGPVPRFPRAAS